MSAHEPTSGTSSPQAKTPEATFEAVFHTSPDAMTINRLSDGLRLEVNEGFTTLLGYDRDEVVGRPPDDPKIWADPEEWMGSPDRNELMAELASKGELHGVQATLRRKDGRELAILASATVIDFNGEKCVIWATVDITDRLAAERRIQGLNRVYAVLSRVNQTLVRERDLQKIYDEVCRVVVEEGGYLAAWVGLVAEDANHLRVAATAGEAASYLEGVDVVLDDPRLGRGPTGISVNERRHVSSQDIDRDARMTPWRDRALAHGFRSSASFPLIVGDVAMGAFTMYSGEVDAFTEEQFALLDGLAADISFAIEHSQGEERREAAERELVVRESRLEELLAERERNLEMLSRSLASVIEVVSRVVESRDPYTAGHQQRVSELAAGIAQEMEMPASAIEEIRLAALIHDVGKISIPAEILSKPGALSDLELSLIKSHAESGYRIIASANMEGPTAELVHQHHERCDGSGYPLGLTAAELLPGSRVLMVADVVEAMVAHRPYRPGLGLEVALSEVERGCGTAYDAEVCDACLTLFRERGFEFSPVAE